MRNLHLHGEDRSRNDQFGVRTLVNPNQRTESPSKRKTSPQNDKEFVREALKLHNDLRRNHGVEPFRLNNDLTKLAQQWGKVSKGILIIDLIISFQPIIWLLPVLLCIVEQNIVMEMWEKISTVNLGQ